MAREDDMEETTMRITKRTVRHLQFLQSTIGLRDSEKKTLDDVVWDAINRAYPAEMQAARTLSDDDEQKKH